MSGQGIAPRATKRMVRATGFASSLVVALFCMGCGSETEVADHPGKAVYQRYCYACHQAGIADAPKLGDKDAWAPRLTKSRAELVDNVIRGMAPGMPPRAGCGTCTDEELAAAVDFMVLRAR
ncbi:MAG: c-type cytochrome [Gammaproteobacteria bacterium]|nr:c-type cytochrome [Gammaproteobacteria bacterium]